jgi:hypothetical protein
VSLIIPHINYSNVVFSTLDSASQKRFNVAFNSCVHEMPCQEHVSHLVPTIIGVSLATHLNFHFLTFLFKVLHIRHRCYVERFCSFDAYFVLDFIVTHHRFLATGHLYECTFGRLVGLVRTNYT